MGIFTVEMMAESSNVDNDCLDSFKYSKWGTYVHNINIHNMSYTYSVLNIDENKEYKIYYNYIENNLTNYQ